ncbi:MAG: NTP transferase domain-containing protein [Tissierellia bacterium]|nr:NTP transferase domain-containing protein [Tissierellia bacterium]
MNAIILAAGMGTRLRPSTDITPKPLIEINGIPMIETQIEYLNQIGICEIIIVTGYMQEEFNYLAEKYNVKFVYNDKFDVYNNLYSMYLVKEYLHNTYVIEGDVYLTHNMLKNNLKTSTYFSGIKEDFTSEWVLKFNSDDQVIKIIVGEGTDYIMSGISYWVQADSKIIKNRLEKLVEENKFSDLFWDHIIKDNLEDFHIKINKMNPTDWFEIDCIVDLEKAERFSVSSMDKL